MAQADVAVVLVEPRTPGNVGSVARVMKNFGFRQLLLVKPQCSHRDAEAKKLAANAADVLAAAKKISWRQLLKNYDYVVATTAKLGTDYNIPRSPLSPAAAAAKLAKVRRRRIAVVFGRETFGLRNSEIADSDMLVSIPAAKSYAAMNISHAAAIVLYEIFRAQQKTAAAEKFTPISAKEKAVLLQLYADVLEQLPFATREKKHTQLRVWRRLVGKALLTRREAFALLGFFRKLRAKLL